MSALSSKAEYVHPTDSAAEFAGWGPWRLGIISNPWSGRNRRLGLSAIRRGLQNYPDVPHRTVRTVEDVHTALEDFARRDLNLIVVNSGDGTVQAVLTSLFGRRLFRSLPLLALLGGGTTNMTHKDLGLTGSREQAMERLMAWAHHGEGHALIRRRTVLKVTHPPHSEPIYGMFLGAACIFKGIEFFHSRLHQLGLSGHPAHLLIMARFLMALARREDSLVSPVSVDIRMDQFTFGKRDCLLLLVTTLDRLIMRLRPFWHDAEGPLQLTAVNARPCHLFQTLPALISGRSIRHANPENGYISCGGREIRLNMKGGFAIDGEIFFSDPRKGPLLIQAGGVAHFLRL